MKNIFFIISLFFLLLTISSSASTSEQSVDSLQKLLKTNIADTSKLIIYGQLFNYYSDRDIPKANEIINSVFKLGSEKKLAIAIGEGNNMMGVLKKYSGDIDSAIFYQNKAEKIFRAENKLSSLASCLMNSGNNLKRKGNLKQAKVNFKEAIEIGRSINNKDIVGSNLINLGLIEHGQNNVNVVFDYYFEALKIFEEIKNNKKYVICCINISNLFSDQKKYDESNKYLNYGIKKAEDNPRLLSGIYGNLANNYSQVDNYEKSIEYYNLSIAESEKIGNLFSIALCNSNLGLMYSKLKNFNKAIYHLKLAEKQFIIEDSKSDLAELYRGFGTAYKDQNKYNEAILYFNKTIQICNDYNYPFIEQYTLLSLSKCYYQLSDYKNAYNFADKYITLSDSINNAQSIEKMLEVQTKYETEKKELEIKNLLGDKKLKNIELEKSALEVKRQNQLKIFFAAGFGLVAILALFILKNLREKQKANKIITQQKEILEEQHKEITDSINYAKRIQTAILPPARLIKELLPNSFVIYKPKDIVAGDFYWLQNINSKTMFAAADCTGHGVPGAMVSVICNNSLNRSVKEFSLSDAGKILDKTREIVVSEFEKSDEEVKDGMDISLCVLDYSNLILNWAGANNPLWIIRKKEGIKAETLKSNDSIITQENTLNLEHSNFTNFELIEYKADKQPIGKYTDSKPFTSQQIQLIKGDTFYIFTDGYVDQFGGENGKKFKSSKLKELLLSIQDKNIESQKEILENSIKNWKGNLEQVDDVCFIGVRI